LAELALQVGVEELVLLCVLKAVTQEISLSRKGEEEGEGCALLSTCYAVLLTVAPLLREASMYMAERLAAVLTSMCRRIISNEQAAAADERIKEALSVVLLVVDAALQPHCRGSNASLVIAMMQEQDHLVPSLRHRAVNEAVGPLLIALTPAHAGATPPMLPTELCLLITHYLQLLEGYSENGLSTLRSTMRQESDSVQHRVRGSGTALMQGTSTSYCYEEGPFPGAFFLPAVWGVTLRCSPDLCRLMPLHCAVLLDPYDAGLLDCDSSGGETSTLNPLWPVGTAEVAV
jgi:Dyggve-Melchior-Clausen syndrome protein